MRSLSALLAFAALFVVTPLQAQVIAYETVDWDADPVVTGGERSLFTMPEPGTIPNGPAYGPFRVMDARHAALVDVTNALTPAQFTAMLRDHPGITTIEMIDCPGTEDDLANLQLGRMIRERGIATDVPAGGSVRSGGVELFLAGARRSADATAEFAVHSWKDDTGLEPKDYAASSPENQRYLSYYRQMGMSPIEAEAFYAMTNAAPFESARWFGAGVMGMWTALEPAAVSAPTSVVSNSLDLAGADSAGADFARPAHVGA